MAKELKQTRKLKPQTKIYSDKYYIDLYKEFITGKRKKLQHFWNKEVGKVIMRHILFDVLRWDRGDICQNFVKEKIVKNYRLTGAKKEFKNSNFEFLNYSVPELNIQRWELVGGTVGNAYWNDDSNKRFALQWFVDTMIENGELEHIDDIPKVVKQKTFDKYRIRGLVANHFNDSIYQAIDFLYPSKFKKWEFLNMKGLDKKEVIESVQWLFQDKLKVEIKNIPIIARKELFEKHSLMSDIVKHFGSYKLAIIEAFPDANFHHWSFHQLEQGFWLKEENRILILKELIEDDLQLNPKDIPKYINNEYLLLNQGNKFISACEKYFDSSFYNWVNTCYPNLFTEDEYNQIAFQHRPSREFDSVGEYQIFQFVNDVLGMDIVYCGRKSKYKLHNKQEGENYIPDFMIDHDILCEYYGFYSPRPTTQYFKDYIEKTHRKNAFYKRYCPDNKLYFLELYEEDLLDNFQGLRDKLDKILLDKDNHAKQ